MRTGRGQVHIRWEGPRSIRKVAPVVAWELTNGDIPEGQRVCHRCDNPTCCNPTHLFLGTQAENIHDCIKKGRRNAFGIQKLHEPQVLEIRGLAAKGFPHAHIAKHYGIARNTVTGIVNGASWRHLPPFNQPIGQDQAGEPEARLRGADVLDQSGEVR